MKQILDGNVLHILSIPKGIVAAVLENVTEDGKMVVEYRMITVDTDEIQRVSNSIYLLSKFGAGHKGVELQVNNHLMCRACIMNNGEIIVIESDGNLRYLDADGYNKWKGIVSFDGEFPCDCAFDGNYLWMCYPVHSTVVRYDIETMTQNLRVGEDNSDIGFKKPCGLFYDNGILYISNKDSHNVWEVDTVTYEAKEIHKFNEAVYQYAKINDTEIIRLESGIYQV